jgi:glycosyltransferase involved in cell wall biosynthesis
MAVEPRPGESVAQGSRQLRVLLVADPRSPTTWGWVNAVRSAGVVVLGVDGRPWPEHIRNRAEGGREPAHLKERVRSLATATPRRLRLAQRSRRIVWPALASMKGRRLRRVVVRARPDLVHALRIPYEAVTALTACPRDVPLAVSIWGNDLTLHASASWLTGLATRRVLMRTALLFADCQRDIELAKNWGLRPTTLTAVLPGGGGIGLGNVLEQAASLPTILTAVPESDRIVVNARGCREYVRNDVLLEALSLLADDLDPHVWVVFIDAVRDEALRRSIQRHRMADKIIVTGKLSPTEVFFLFRRAEICVSITEHDGTPNSLLEAMAAGVIPVCGDLPPIREWVKSGRNGFLAAFDDPYGVADALRCALRLSNAECSAMRAENIRIISARAERGLTGEQAARKYRSLVEVS